MPRGRKNFLAQCAAILCACGPSLFAQTPTPAEQFEVTMQHASMPTRDGVKLATDIYFPSRGGQPVAGKFPVIMERTPYGKSGAKNWATFFAARGYISVAQDTRGRFESEGVWRFLADDQNDGYDTAKWLGDQPWFGGAIGTVGTSYPGGTQHALALSGAPFLKAMVPAYAVSNAGEFGMRYQGAFELRFFNWIYNIGGPDGSVESRDPKTKQALTDAGERVREYASRLPMRAGATALKLAPEYERWLTTAMTHGGNDEFWRTMGADIIDNVGKYADAPVVHETGWYDSWTHQVADMNYPALAKAKRNQRLLVGPWTHGGQGRSFAGEAEFGPESTIDQNQFQLRWFDHWLKNVDNGVEKDTPVRIFVMGGGDAHKTTEGRIFVGGHWRDEHEWPLARTRFTPFYLHANGALNRQKPATEQPASYQFDPRHPVPTIGGSISSENAPKSKKSFPARPNDTGNFMERGAWDQRCREQFWNCEDELPLSARNDVLVFQTEPLNEDTEITGPLEVKLWISSDAPDTDFTAKLVDVYPPNGDFPAGVELNISDGILRARFRDGANGAEKLMKPGAIYPVTVTLYPTALVFPKGHRIRVDISSSNFPRFEVNPNTGEPLNDNRRVAIATNTIYYDAQHPSHIVLPLIPAAEQK